MVIIIPKNNAPLMFLAKRIPVITRPINANNAEGDFKFPRVIINPPSFNTLTPFSMNIFPVSTIPAFINPINAINRPIPTDTAFLRFIGIELKIASLTWKNDNIINIIPSRNTAVKANCQECPIPKTTV